ncbi:SPOR domain-containing protein [Enterovibrio baiacu]|uniref:SPOR domain-containing protein n=1 Tax=Enterovibrio baiacu TaxID=2491023 RepID=UPI003D117AC8
MIASSIRIVSALILSVVLNVPASSAESACSPERIGTWNVVDETCPIGDGLWGKDPASQQGQFWVQCGIVNDLPDAWFSGQLAKSVLANQVMLRKEGETYRCLAGPFEQFSTAKKVRDGMRKQPSMSAAFVREVSTSGEERLTPAPVIEMIAQAPSTLSPVVDVAVADTAMVEATLLAAPVALVASADAVSEPMMNAQRNDVMPELDAMTAAPAKTTAKPKKVKRNRKFRAVAGVQVPKPKNGERHYSRNEEMWLRASFAEAEATCTENGFRVVSAASLKKLIADPEARSAVPNRLPYWVASGEAYDLVIMVPMPLSQSSEVNVLCE